MIVYGRGPSVYGSVWQGGLCMVVYGRGPSVWQGPSVYGSVWQGA